MTRFSEIFPRLLHTPTKYEENQPYGCEAIAKRKSGYRESGGSGQVVSLIYKEASLMGSLGTLNYYQANFPSHISFAQI